MTIFSPALFAVCCSLLLCGFSLFINNKNGLAWIALLALAALSGIMAKVISSIKEIPRAFGFNPFLKKTGLWCLAGIGCGILAGIGYTSGLNQQFSINSLTFFALTAAGIGIAEELLFRGFIWRLLLALRPWQVIAISTAAHTAYKGCLFFGLFISHSMHLFPFIFFTLAGSMTCSLLRRYSNHIVPPLIAHAVFDILVYGSLAIAPWWVWG